MQVDVDLFLLAPGVQAGQQAGQGPQVFRIGQQLPQRVRAGVKQQVGKRLLVVSPERNQVLGRGQRAVAVRTVQQTRLPIVEPAFAGQGRAQGAAAVVAGVVVRRVDMPLGATPPVSAHGGGAAVAQLPGGVQLVGCQRVRLGERLEVLLQDGLHGQGHAAIRAHLATRVHGTT